MDIAVTVWLFSFCFQCWTVCSGAVAVHTGPFVTHNTGQESSAGSRPVAFMLILVTWTWTSSQWSVVSRRVPMLEHSRYESRCGVRCIIMSLLFSSSAPHKVSHTNQAEPATSQSHHSSYAGGANNKLRKVSPS